jgi:hypothetical protein
MIWPWTTAGKLEAAIARGEWAERELRKSEDRVLELARDLKAQAETFQAQIEAKSKENHLLLDRIVQMTGQPPIYEKPAPVQPQTESNVPDVPVRHTFDSVHEAARKAIADGTFQMPKRRA